MTHITDDMLTDWFASHVEPARPGYYEVRYNLVDGLEWRFWNGEWWQFDEHRTNPGDYSLFGKPPHGQFEQWRGLRAPLKD